MKKQGRWLLVAVLFGMFMMAGSSKETRIATARVLAGEGMIRLTANAAERPKIALTFDDGPSKKYTPVLLDGLKKRKVQASFFLTGKNIQGNEELVKRMQEEGHLIGNHTYHHVQLDRVPERTAREEIEKTSNEIFEITGCYPAYLRPPFGSWNKNLNLNVEMFLVPWNIDTLDWKTKNVASILEIVKKQVKEGAIILMHDGYASSVEAAMRLIDDLQKKGYEFVTVDQLLLL